MNGPVGSERMPALFAKGGMQVTATDAPQSVDNAQGWSSTGQYSSAIEILDKETFLDDVRFHECDMNNIGDNVPGYDFCWSSCAPEHLGSLQLGMNFIVAPDTHFLDGYVDTPPYATPTPTTGPAHLKLELYGYACTSVGITVQRGR